MVKPADRSCGVSWRVDAPALQGRMNHTVRRPPAFGRMPLRDRIDRFAKRALEIAALGLEH